MEESIAEFEFIVPDYGDNVKSGIGLSYRPARLHRMGRAGTQPNICRSWLYPPVRDYEFGLNTGNTPINGSGE
jgi:hypothetical protein